MSLSSNNITIMEITGVFFRLNINTDVAPFFLPKKPPLHYFNSCLISSFILSNAAYLLKGYEPSLLCSCLPFPQFPVHLFISHVISFQCYMLEHTLLLKKHSREGQGNPFTF